MTKTYDIVGHRKIFYIISLSIVTVALLVSLIFGVNLSIEFKGGTMITYSYSGEIDVSKFESIATEVVGQDVNINQGQVFQSDDKYIEISFPSSDSVSQDVITKLDEKLQSEFKDSKLSAAAPKIVKPSTGRTFFIKCLVALAFASIILVVYIALRFKKISGLSAGVMAIVALFHDVIVVYATFVIFRIPLDSNFMAVALTILGYSINDTIVIYDRIRENKKLLGKSVSHEELVNTSINQSMSRSINTSVSTVLVMIVVSVVAVIFDVTSILSFSFPLIIGMISGVYSTICIAGPLWVDWIKYKSNRQKHTGRKKGQ